MFSIEPPKPITRGIYICANKYSLDMLLPLFKVQDVYGGILIEGAEFKLYRINEYECELLMASEVAQLKNHNKGGQSALRFRRLRENKHNRIVDYISDEIYNCFWNKDQNVCNVKGLLIAGSGNLKNEVTGTDLFKKYFNEFVICIKNIDNITEQSMQKIFKQSQEDIEKYEIKDEKLAFSDVTYLQTTCPDVLVYGISEIKQSISDNTLSKILCTNEMYSEIEKIKNSKTKIIKISKLNSLRDYGGCIGILFNSIQRD